MDTVRLGSICIDILSHIDCLMIEGYGSGICQDSKWLMTCTNPEHVRTYIESLKYYHTNLGKAIEALDSKNKDFK
jgi:hypothetical protein